MKCETKKCVSDGAYIYDGKELCSSCVSALAQTKPDYYAKETPEEERQ